MPLNKKVVIDFQNAYRNDFGEDISYDEAELMAQEALGFCRWLVRKSKEKLSTVSDLTNQRK